MLRSSRLPYHTIAPQGSEDLRRTGQLRIPQLDPFQSAVIEGRSCGSRDSVATCRADPGLRLVSTKKDGGVDAGLGATETFQKSCDGVTAGSGTNNNAPRFCPRGASAKHSQLKFFCCLQPEHCRPSAGVLSAALHRLIHPPGRLADRIQEPRGLSIPARYCSSHGGECE